MKFENKIDTNTALIVGVVIAVIIWKDDLENMFTNFGFSLFGTTPGWSANTGTSAKVGVKGGTSDIGSRTGEKKQVDSATDIKNTGVEKSSMGVQVFNKIFGAGKGSNTMQTKKEKGVKYLVLQPGSYTIEIPGFHPPRFDFKLSKVAQYPITKETKTSYEIQYNATDKGLIKKR